MLHILDTSKPLTNRKPKDWINKGYKIIVPFKFKWRWKIGKIKCNCKTCIEEYTPWYGITWFHDEKCAIRQLIEKRPTIQNLNQYYGQDLTVITQSEE